MDRRSVLVVLLAFELAIAAGIARCVADVVPAVAVAMAHAHAHG